MNYHILSVKRHKALFMEDMDKDNSAAKYFLKYAKVMKLGLNLQNLIN